MTRDETDIAIVGAGPAGIAAGIETARRGLATVVLDENPAVGGRIWQGLEAREPMDADESTGLATIRALAASGATIHLRANVWGIEPDGTVFWTREGEAHSLRARRIVLATGTTERPLPIPGWTLPGVMTVGAAQIALKTGRLVPDGNTWIAGQGPLMLLYAAQAIRAGGTIAGIVDLSRSSVRWLALPHVRHAAADIRKGLGWMREIRRARVPVFRATGLRAEGDGSLSRISFEVKGERRTQAADLLLLHDGVVPSVQIARALGCAHEWDVRQRYWRPVVDEWGETSIPGIVAAGDGAGVGGAAAAIVSGRIAGIGCAVALGRIDPMSGKHETMGYRARRPRVLASRPFIDTLFAPLPVAPDDETTICRCEEVTAGQIRHAATLGVLGANQLKAFTRCGMGPCQGRMCGLAAAEILADARGVPAKAIEPFRARFPARPLTVGELAGLAG